MTHAVMPLVCLALPLSFAAAAQPRLPVRFGPDEAAAYRNAVAPVMGLAEADLVRLVPVQSGIYFTDCPNCDDGIQEGQFQGGRDAKFTPWDPANPLVMRCAYCGHQYPSAKFPMAKTLDVHGPNGQPAQFPYWEDAQGYRHFFAARIDYHRARYLEDMGWRLGRAYWLTKEPQYARRCALILQRFAAVFPGYCYHFDYPFTQKIIKDGNVEPKDFQPAFRVARWTWWAYMDIPSRLLEAYDLIHDSGELEKLSGELGHEIAPEIEAFFAETVRQVMANQDDLTNMSPGMWADFIQAGRVLQRPAWVHEAIGRLERFVATGFNYDGTWIEGAPSYHSQVVGNLQAVLQAAQGYSDPPGYEAPQSKRRFDDLDLKTALPAVQRVGSSLEQMRLPGGRFVPVHDTWSSNGGQALAASRPWLLPALGHACLGGGEQQAQWQVHLTWSAGMGHAHYDGLSVLFCSTQELLSDVGYTHSRDRVWTLPTAAHNTVVIDHLNQAADRSTFGSLRCFAGSNPACQVVAVDNPQAYPKLATTYRRTLVAVNGEYVVDLFEVAGGQQHDYFLHGCADLPGTVQALQGDQALATTAVATLVPAGTGFQEARNENECVEAARPGYAYGYLRDVQRVSAALPAACTLDFSLQDNPARLRALLLTQPGDQLFVGRNPAVRNAKENDGNLRGCWRPFAMLRRSGGQSLFAGILGVNAGAVLSVRRLELPGAALAIEVACGERRDLILLRPRGLQGEWQGQPLAAEAELAVIRGATPPALTVVAGRVRWGDRALEAMPVAPAQLLAVDPEAGVLSVAGALLPPAGTVVLLDQAGQRVSPFTVVKAEQRGETSRLTVAEGVGFGYDAATQTSTFTCQPKSTHQGPHLLRLTPVAHLR